MNIFKTIGEDIQAVKERDPAAQNSFVIWLTYPGLHARWSHVVEHWLWNHGLRSLARVSSQFTRWMTGVEIHPAAQIGRRFFIDHAMGDHHRRDDGHRRRLHALPGRHLGRHRQGDRQAPPHPRQQRAGGRGGVRCSATSPLGDNVKVGGGAVVVKDVPPDCTVVGMPGPLVVRIDGKRLSQPCDAYACRGRPTASRPRPRSARTTSAAKRPARPPERARSSSSPPQIARPLKPPRTPTTNAHALPRRSAKP